MSKANIFIVEDSFIVALHLQTTLENEGYKVIGKSDSGEDALKFIEQKRPDLVLMDIMLTGQLDGIQTAAIIKSKFNLPVIYITALTDSDTIQRAKVTEPYGYLTKPFEDREIFTVIEMALYKHGIESRLRESEEKYFSTVNSISDAVVVIDRDYCITFMNPSAEAMTQHTQAEAKGKLITDILKLRDEATDEFPVNPVQCVIGGLNLNAMPDGLLLEDSHGNRRPIGESSLSPLLDVKENFSGLVIIFKDLTEKKEHAKAIKELETQRMAALIEGQEKERSRIAKDLHDGLGQMLNAIKMNTNVIMESKKDAASLYRLIDEAIQESVRISENLLPAKLKDFDLVTCLRSLCNQMGKGTNTLINFLSASKKMDVGQSQKVNIYRIAQEAVNNAVKHAQAKTITVQLIEDQDRVRLTIEDDGKGITGSLEQDLYKKNGLINMRDRAEIMGGRLTMESDASRGTVILLDVPL
jgi:PAS domain S-box-containing protein